MKQSLPGLFRNTAAALRRSDDDLSCAMAFSLGQLIDNLRRVKEGEATIDEFFGHYVFDSERRDLADSVVRDVLLGLYRIDVAVLRPSTTSACKTK